MKERRNATVEEGREKVLLSPNSFNKSRALQRLSVKGVFIFGFGCVLW